MVSGGKIINKVHLYTCGYCINNLSHVFKGHKKEKRKFPALVVLIEHNKYGNILYDTGYSNLVYKNKLLSTIYNIANPTYCKDEDTIIEKLKKDNIDIESINKIILSHAHPDHIGGLKYISKYELISTKYVMDTLYNARLKDLVFKNMVPNHDIKKTIVNSNIENHFLNKYFDKVYDILGDKSIFGIELSGHASGQLGIFLPQYNTFFAADAGWGEDLIYKVKDMRFIPRMVQNNFTNYKETIERLIKLKEDNKEIEIIYSHGNLKEKIYE